MGSGNEGEHSKHPLEHNGDDAACSKSEQCDDLGQTSEISLGKRYVTDGNGSNVKSPITKADSITKTQSIGSLTTSSSASSSEELFKVDTSKFTPRSRVSFSIKTTEDSQPVSNNDTGTPRTAPPVISSVSPTQNPPVQTMDRSEGYDPSRIPSSVFDSKPSTPVDWSVASNDSLFSLNVGSYSFSREQFLYDDLSKSTDFDKQYEESGKDGEPYGKSSEFIMFIPPTPIQSPGMDRKSVEITRNSEASVSGVVDDATRKSVEERYQNKAHSNSPRFSGGNCSNSSFAFPILTDQTKSDIGKQKTPPHPQQPVQRQQLEAPKRPIGKPRKSSPYNCFSCFYSCSCCRRSS